MDMAEVNSNEDLKNNIYISCDEEELSKTQLDMLGKKWEAYEKFIEKLSEMFESMNSELTNDEFQKFLRNRIYNMASNERLEKNYDADFEILKHQNEDSIEKNKRRPPSEKEMSPDTLLVSEYEKPYYFKPARNSSRENILSTDIERYNTRKRKISFAKLANPGNRFYGIKSERDSRVDGSNESAKRSLREASIGSEDHAFDDFDDGMIGLGEKEIDQALKHYDENSVLYNVNDLSLVETKTKRDISPIPYQTHIKQSSAVRNTLLVLKNHSLSNNLNTISQKRNLNSTRRYHSSYKPRGRPRGRPRSDMLLSTRTRTDNTNDDDDFDLVIGNPNNVTDTPVTRNNTFAAILDPKFDPDKHKKEVVLSSPICVSQAVSISSTMTSIPNILTDSNFIQN